MQKVTCLIISIAFAHSLCVQAKEDVKLEFIEAERGRGVASASLEIQLIYLDSADAILLKGLKAEKLADRVIALAGEQQKKIVSLEVVVWAGQNTSTGFGYLGSPMDRGSSTPRIGFSEVSLSFAPAAKWVNDAIPIAVRCSCYNPLSPGKYRSDSFHATFVANLDLKVDSTVALGEGVPTLDKKVLYPLIRTIAIRHPKPGERPPSEAIAPLYSIASNFGILDYRAKDMAIDGDYIFVIGGGLIIDSGLETPDLKYGDMAWCLEKRHKDTGALVETFGRKGIVLTDAGGETRRNRVIALDDHHIYIASCLRGVGPYYEKRENFWQIEKRDKKSGNLVQEFGVHGVVTSPDKASGQTWLRSIRDLNVVDGHIFVLGSERTWTTSGSTRIEKRNKNTGALIPEFGENGVVRNPKPSFEWDMDVFGECLFVIGKNSLGPGSESETDFEWHIEKRSTLTGSLFEEFGRSGVVEHNPTSGYEQPYAVAADKDSVYIVGDDNCLDSGEWRIEKRDSSSGELEQNFGDLGIIVVNPGPWSDSAEQVLTDANYLFIAGQQRLRGLGNPDWRLEKREKNTGSLVQNFGTGGIVPLEHRYWRPGGILGISMDDKYLYLLRKHCGIANSHWRIEKRSKQTGGK